MMAINCKEMSNHRKCLSGGCTNCKFLYGSGKRGEGFKLKEGGS